MMSRKICEIMLGMICLLHVLLLKERGPIKGLGFS